MIEFPVLSYIYEESERSLIFAEGAIFFPEQQKGPRGEGEGRGAGGGGAAGGCGGGVESVPCLAWNEEEGMRRPLLQASSRVR